MDIKGLCNGHYFVSKKDHITKSYLLADYFLPRYTPYSFIIFCFLFNSHISVQLIQCKFSVQS